MPAKTEDKSKSADAKLFWNGRSQAVRLPKEFRFAGDRVRVRRVGAGVLLEPALKAKRGAKKETAEEWFARIDSIKGDPIFPEGRKGSDLVAAMQASPDKEMGFEGARDRELDGAGAGDDTVFMATQPIADGYVSEEEYLSTSYDPDCEYDEGVVVERNLGEIEHAYLQILLGTLFTIHAQEWNTLALTEQRVQIAPRRFRVPDVCVLRSDAPWEKIVTHPPLIAIEILSPEDTIRSAEKKAAEYLQFGVVHVWVIDPYARVGYRATGEGLERVAEAEYSVPGTPICVRFAELFEKLDQARERGQR